MSDRKILIFIAAFSVMLIVRTGFACDDNIYPILTRQHNANSDGINTDLEEAIGLIEAKTHKKKLILPSANGMQVHDLITNNVVADFTARPGGTFNNKYWSPRGDKIITVDRKNNMIDVWDTAKQKSICSIENKVSQSHYFLGFSADEKKLIVAGNGNYEVAIWQINFDGCTLIANLPKYYFHLGDTRVKQINFAKNDNVIITTFSDGKKIISFLPPPRFAQSRLKYNDQTRLINYWLKEILSLEKEFEKEINDHKQYLDSLNRQPLNCSEDSSLTLNLRERDVEITSNEIKNLLIKKEKIRTREGAIEYIIKLNVSCIDEVESRIDDALKFLSDEELLYLEILLPSKNEVKAQKS